MWLVKIKHLVDEFLLSEQNQLARSSLVSFAMDKNIWHFKALGGTSDKISSLVVKQAQ